MASKMRLTASLRGEGGHCPQVLHYPLMEPSESPQRIVCAERVGRAQPASPVGSGLGGAGRGDRYFLP